MKKIIPILSIGLVIFLVPIATLAIEQVSHCTTTRSFSEYSGVICPSLNENNEAKCSFDDPDYNCTVCCLLNTIVNVTNWIFVGVMSISGIMTILGGFKIVTAGGNVDEVNKGRNFITFAIIGFLVALIANAIPGMVVNVLGLG